MFSNTMLQWYGVLLDTIKAIKGQLMCCHGRVAIPLVNAIITREVLLDRGRWCSMWGIKLRSALLCVECQVRGGGEDLCEITGVPLGGLIGSGLFIY